MVHRSLFANIFYPLVGIFVGIGIIAITFFIDNQERLIENNLIKTQVLVSQLVGAQIESSYNLETWPFITLNKISASDDVIFWKIVDQEGYVEMASETELWGQKINDPEVASPRMVTKEQYLPDIQETVKIIIYPLNIRVHQKPWTFWLGISLNSVKEAKHALLRISILVCAAIVLFLVLFSFYLSKGITAPIKKLAYTAEIIGRGDLNKRVEITAKNELGEFAQSFNTMAEKLQKSMVSVQELKAEKKRFQDVAESTGDWIWEVDNKGKYVYASPVVEKVLGYKPEEMRGKLFYDFFHPDEKENLKKETLEFLDKKIPFKDFQNRNIKKNGAVVIVETTGVPIFSEEGSFLGYRGVDRDITERKKVEEDLKKAYHQLKQTQKQLIQSEKMAGIGQLAAGVAHEINNPAGFVMSNLDHLQLNIQKFNAIILVLEEFIQNNMPQDPEKLKALQDRLHEVKAENDLEYFKEDLPELVSECLSGMNRIKNIVSNLKNFTHPGTEGYVSTNLNNNLENALSLVFNELKYKCEIIKEYGELPKIKINTQQIEQVFINILINASQAIEKKGTISLKTYVQDENICIEIADDGKGVSQEGIDKIFDPFFTTKGVGEGTGLGLSIVYGIIKEHNGQIDVESRIDKGTKFIIKLPVEKKET
ncbi:MAG: PAS domain S-box protein [Candidatus Omnitrophica bacterium]|nr:PAS domain S-box protein [Candidatus Omnitrophota bacterium]